MRASAIKAIGLIMGFGLFGKAPAKRDFIALGLPRRVLEPFENWMQASVSASRVELGGAWREHYLVAPVWRFWIGSAILGQSAAGALIPSVDGVGRFFPLALMFCADEGQEIMPPPFAPQEEWYAALEARLLSVLDEEAAVDPERLPAGLPAPELAGAGPAPTAAPVGRGVAWEGEDAGALLAGLAAADYWTMLPGRSLWWTAGGSAARAMVYARNALPDPYFFANMLRGAAAKAAAGREASDA